MNDIMVILDNIRSIHNVGSILRSAEGFGVRKVSFTGYTPYPTMPDDNRLPHQSRKITDAIHKTALGAEKMLELTQFNSINDSIIAAKDQGYSIVAVEQAANSTKLPDYRPTNKIAIILGNEVSGIASNILDQCDVILEIPMLGQKESFNVSVTAGITLYALRLKDYQS